MITGMPPLRSTSFGNISSPRLFACSFSTRFMNRLRRPGSFRPSNRSFAHIAWYHNSRVFIRLNSAMDSR